MSGNAPGNQNQEGFTYLAVLATVIVFGISVTGAATYWRTVMDREQETQLLFRGDRIRRAIAAYAEESPSGRPDDYPDQLSDLLKDPRQPTVRRYLRKIYPDPMTPDGEWELIRQEGGGIRGVYSRSRRKPRKTGNFPVEYKAFEKAETYRDWKFDAGSGTTPQPNTGGTAQ